MSHITEAKIRVRDMDALNDVAVLLGGELVLGQRTHRTYGRFVGDSAEGAQFVAERGEDAIGKCDHAIRLKNSGSHDYEIGVVPSLDGDGYSLVYDSWGPGKRLEAAFGTGLNGIKREYAAAVATKAVERKMGRRYKVEREDLPNRRIKLRVRKR